MPEDFTLPDGFTLPADTTPSGPPLSHWTRADAGECADVSILGERPSWERKAACRGKGCNLWFTSSTEDLEAARAVCEPCSVRRECLAYALSDRTLEGIWAGTTEADRRRMRKVSA